MLAVELARQVGATLPADVLDQLAGRDYRGNVRELRNAVQAYLAIGILPDSEGHEGLLDLALREMLDTRGSFAEQRDQLADTFARVFLGKLLSETDGNLTEAARRCGLERSYLGKLVRKLGLK